MATLHDAVNDFLAQQRIAVAGVSRSGEGAANLIYRRLREAGYDVFAVNPTATTVEGDPCYPDLSSLPERPDGLMIVTPPEAAPALVQACADLGIPRVWMHRSFGTGSVSNEATDLGQQLGLTVIPGACPMMFLDPVDGGHKCIRWMLKWTGGLPQPVVPTDRPLDASA
ncbi:MAG: CoA-binding protein [Bacteroidetes bacterium]|jgi:predicted CoA-binding protein|nr:CoA-binding protein [Bacteroidota bacterium]